MPVIRISGFSGTSPRTGPTNLADTQAQIASNVKLQSGELRPWKKPVQVYTPYNAGVQAIYKMNGPANAFQWLEWTCDADAVSGPQADTSDYRIYYTGANFTPKKTNWAMVNSGGAKPYPNSFLEMGVPGPTVAPTLATTGGSPPNETRAYLYTWLSTFGAITEESAPSPATLITTPSSGSTVNVSGWGTAPVSSGGANYNITGMRLYRTVTGATTVTYELVDQMTVTPSTGAVVSGQTTLNGVVMSGSTYPDTRTTAQLGQSLPSTYYLPPPSGLQGLVSMPNGILAGFVNNQIWFSDPYLPHSWPASYMLTTEFPVVGLGVFGTTLFVGTTKNPYLITGTTPSQMTQEKLPLLQPCVSKRSIASDQWGVVYATPAGLAAIGPGIQDMITTSLFTRDEWNPLVPSTMIGMLYNTFYIGFYNTGSVQSSIVLARNDVPPLANYDFYPTCVFVERTTGNIYCIQQSDNNVYQLDADTQNNTVFQYRTKMFPMANPLSFAALQVDADYTYMQNAAAFQAAYNAAVTANQATWTADAATTLGGSFNDYELNNLELDGSNLQDLPTATDTRYINITVFADGNQVFSASPVTHEPIRMPGGFKAYLWEILITGNSPMRGFSMATTMTELKGGSYIPRLTGSGATGV
jgi:hypothetical protein